MITGFWFVVSGCVVEIHRGNGVPETEERDVGSFTGVTAAASIPVDVAQADDDAVLVTCDGNLLDEIVTRVRGDDLIVEIADHPRPSRLIELAPQVDCRVMIASATLERVAVTGSGRLTASGSALAIRRVTDTGSGGVGIEGPIGVPELEVVSSGSGAITIDRITASDVSLTASGSGWVTVGGAADRLDLVGSGSGDIHARELVADRVGAVLSGSGDADVTALSWLHATLSGSGDLDVWGDPDQRDVTETGSGRVTYR